MPSRIIREGILTSAKLARLGWAEEVFYRRLMSVVDDFGRYYADVGMLRAACYPRQLNKVSDSDVGKFLRAVADAALVRVYPAEDGESYLELLKFDQQVRAKKSKFPDPPSGCATDAQHLHSRCLANDHLDVSVSVSVIEDVDVDEGVEPARKRAGATTPPRPDDGEREREHRASRLPSDWALSDDLRAWAIAERPGLNIELVAAKFRDHWKAKGGKEGRKLDWPATWRNWVRDERAPQATGNGSHSGGYAAARNRAFAGEFADDAHLTIDEEKTHDIALPHARR